MIETLAIFFASTSNIQTCPTSKEIGKTLVISHRTVEIYRARLMRKYKASTTADLVHKLMAGE